jgi:hypothetical protein
VTIPSSSVSDVLRGLDERADGFQEIEVQMAIGGLLSALLDRGETPSVELEAERLAFAFQEEGGESYFGPSIGKHPSAENITPAILAYWVDRARASKHPVFRIRYAGLAWELAPKVKGTQRVVEMAHILVDSIIELSQRGLGEADVALVDHHRHLAD